MWKDFNGLLNTEACIVMLVNLTYAVSFDFKDMDLDLDHFLNLEQLIPAGFTVAKGSIF